MALTWMEHAGRRILVTTYGRVHEDNMRFLDQQGEIERHHPGLLILSDYRGTAATAEYIEKVKAYGREFRSGPTNVRNAVIGITGLKQILFRAYLAFTGDKHTRAFDGEEQAKAWLVS